MTGIQKNKRNTLLSSSSSIRGYQKNYQEVGSFFDILKKMVITYYLTHQ